MDTDDILDLNREIVLSRRLEHELIVKLHSVFEDQSRISLVLEFCSGPSVSRSTYLIHLVNRGDFINEKALC